jgi:hypothetical protein
VTCPALRNERKREDNLGLIQFSSTSSVLDFPMTFPSLCDSFPAPTPPPPIPPHPPRHSMLLPFSSTTPITTIAMSRHVNATGATAVHRALRHARLPEPLAVDVAAAAVAVCVGRRYVSIVLYAGLSMDRHFEAEGGKGHTHSPAHNRAGVSRCGVHGNAAAGVIAVTGLPHLGVDWEGEGCAVLGRSYQHKIHGKKGV